jgi:hypothetical protein
MTIDHDQLLEDVRLVATGKPPSAMWQRALRVNAWRRQGPSSRNYWDMALPSACVVDPALATEWILERLGREHAAYEDDIEFCRFDAFEFNSPIYHGWSAQALLVAFARFRPQNAEQESARSLMRKHLRARTVIWALCSQTEVTQGGGRYRGAGGYPAGLRGKPYYLDRNDNQRLDDGEKVNEFNQANPTYARILGLEFHWGWRRHTPLARLVEAEGVFDAAEKQRLKRILAADLAEGDGDWITGELGFVRLAVACEVRKTVDRVVTFLDGGTPTAQRPTPIHHTAPLWFSELVTGRAPYCPWPYTTTRLRQSPGTRNQWRSEVRPDQGQRVLTAEATQQEVYRLREFRDGAVGRTRQFALPQSPEIRLRLQVDDGPLLETS